MAMRFAKLYFLIEIKKKNKISTWYRPSLIDASSFL